GAYNVLEFCRKTKADRIVYTQTVFDISLSVVDGQSIDPFTPRNFSFKGDHAMYVISKNTAVDMIEHYHQEYGIKRFIFRLPTIYNYSPYQYYFPNGVKTLRPLYLMIDRAKNGEDIELWGDPNYSKDMVHVYDFSQMICRAMLIYKNEGFYNVGTGNPVTLKEQIETIIDVFSPSNKKSKIVYRSDKKASGGFIMDISNAITELGYVPQYNCKKLFENYKEEMELNKFASLRLSSVQEDK
ncbi:MAG: NAD(P)-dependent oxidoreductase, partial [Clostridia bacterium]